MRIAIVQYDIIWESPEGNLEKLSEILRSINKVDLIVLPEMFSTGFSMSSVRISEPGGGKAFHWMKSISNEIGSVLVGSLAVEENGAYFNRLFWVDGNKVQSYDKRHLFRMAGEHENYKEGKSRLIVEYKGWKFCPQICYDLRFPVWSRNRWEDGKAEYDCSIYIANWPAVRSAPWVALLQARSIENQAYVIGVNRVGKDGNGIEYSGHSRVFDPRGKELMTQ